MPSTSGSIGLYHTTATTGGNSVILSHIESTSITAHRTDTYVSATYEFVVEDATAVELLSSTRAIAGSNCHYAVANITDQGPYWSVQLAMTPGASNTELQNLMLSTSEGCTASCQLLQYIASSDTSNYFSTMLGGITSRQLTDEEKETLETLRRTREAEAERKTILRNQAIHRAIHLLWSHLSPVQRRSLKKHGWFNVVSKCGVKYRLLYTLHGNVLRLGANNKVEQAFCGHMGSNIPIADTLLAQKLLLRHNPEQYESTANKVSYEHTSWCRPQKHFADEIHSALCKPLPANAREHVCV